MNESCGVDLIATPSGDRRPWSPHVREANPLMFGSAEPFNCLTEVDLFADLSTAEIAAMDLIRQGRGRIMIQDTAALQTIARRTT